MKFEKGYGLGQKAGGINGDFVGDDRLLGGCVAEWEKIRSVAVDFW